ncbi:hypothetical protein predicted by Glimmer/Critica [Helicobacter acinonychis str. Sheeba]|uniref:Uncharacterized protein n=1 Tax=Helicobacter acinonychis (strain Sheeba) TaxID=382638 RepID=Q17YF0_HELAH|nr:hypothetical protein predicted by Glimmer/Critica [Helicobacter acinonychis str. Sheeba]
MLENAHFRQANIHTKYLVLSLKAQTNPISHQGALPPYPNNSLYQSNNLDKRIVGSK